MRDKRRTLSRCKRLDHRRRLLKTLPNAVDSPSGHFRQASESTDLAGVALDNRDMAGVEEVCTKERERNGKRE
jgi:hypothetical protein